MHGDQVAVLRLGFARLLLRGTGLIVGALLLALLSLAAAWSAGGCSVTVASSPLLTFSAASTVEDCSTAVEDFARLAGGLACSAVETGVAVVVVVVFG
eukprot:m.129985 g.129985  ORF g.129985 m.129985 type:complete len:98 (-) comp15866_c0_seq4:2074-2367(-)